MAKGRCGLQDRNWCMLGVWSTQEQFMDTLGLILTTRQQQLGLLCSGAVASTAEYDSCGVANLPHSASSARQSFLQLVVARSQRMTQATVIPLYFQNTSFRSLEGHSQMPSSLPHLSACQIICFKRGKDNFFFFLIIQSWTHRLIRLEIEATLPFACIEDPHLSFRG